MNAEMNAGQARYCTRCGAALPAGAAFCVRCGAPRAAGDARARAAGPAAAAPGSLAQATIVARQAVGGAGMAMSLGGALSLPWQTFHTGQTPDVRSLLAAGAPLAQRAVVSSLRRPAIALLITAVLDLAVALISGQPAALQMAGLRAVLGVGTAVLGMVAGNKAGPLRKITGFASAGTGLVQLASVLVTAVSGVMSPARLLALVPSVISQLASLVMLAKTSIAALRTHPT